MAFLISSSSPAKRIDAKKRTTSNGSRRRQKGENVLRSGRVRMIRSKEKIIDKS
jgi:hypothetical protein